jgi:hypothetical protein
MTVFPFFFVFLHRKNFKKMKKTRLFTMLLTLTITVSAFGQSKVYMTKEITPQALVKIYKALGMEAQGRVAVKISTGEGGNTHYLKPTLIRDLVDEVNGTIVECCTAYGGTRQDPKKHWETIHEHGFDSIFAVDLMDEFGQIRIPIQDKKHLKYDIVGEHLANYDFMINLAHFKGHAMGGFGGVMKMPPSVWHPRQESAISIQREKPMIQSWHGHLSIWLPERHKTSSWSRWLLLHRPYTIISTVR